MDPLVVDILDTVVITKTDEEECIPSTTAPQFSDLFEIADKDSNVSPPKDQVTHDGNGTTPMSGVEDPSARTVKMETQRADALEKHTSSLNESESKAATEKVTEMPLQQPEITQSKSLTDTHHTSDTSYSKQVTSDISQRSHKPFGDSIQVDQIAMEMVSDQPPVELEFSSPGGEQNSLSTGEGHTTTAASSSSGPDFSSLLEQPGQKEALDDEFDFDMPPPQQSTTPAVSKAVTPVVTPVVTQKPAVSVPHSQTLIQVPVTQSVPKVKVNQELGQGEQGVEAQKTESVVEGQKATKQVISIEMSAVAMTTETSEAVDEWENVQTITPGLQDESSQSAKPSVPVSPLVSYTDLYQHACQSDLDQFKGQIHSSIHRSGFKAIKHALFGPPKLHKDLQGERDKTFCLTHYTFSNQDTLHQQSLQTIYKKLTGAKFDCPRHGSHWEHIGFQGNDPSTDLRGCGMLGLLQLLYAVTTPLYLPVTREIYALSLHEAQNFPFCIAGINMTRIVIQTLREDCFNKECNKSRGQSEALMSVVNQMYMAAFYDFYTVWKQQHKTIADTGFVLRDLELRLKKHPNILLAQLEQRLKHQQGGATGNSEVTVDSPIVFSKMEE